MSALDRAIKELGGQTALAKAIGCGQSRISNWIQRESAIEPAACVLIEQATGGAVTRKDLRPDDWAAIWPELASSVKQEA